MAQTYHLGPNGQLVADANPGAKLSTGGTFSFDLSNLQGDGKTRTVTNAETGQTNEDAFISFTGADGTPLQAQKMADGGWAVNKAIDYGGGWLGGRNLSRKNGEALDIYNADGTFRSTDKFSGFTDQAVGPWGALAILGAAGGAAAAGLGGAAGGAAAGTATAGAGGAAGVAGLGDAGLMYAGADAAAAGSLGGGASLSGGAAALGGTGAMGAGAAATGAGVPPPANPFVGGASNSLLSGSSLIPGISNGQLLGQGANLLGGLYGASQASSAADAQLQATREAQAQFKPWIDNGAWGMNQLGTMLGRNGADAATAAFQQDPGYQFRLSEGNKALERSASRMGGLNSGKFLKDAMTYNQGQASQEFGNSTNRLLALSGMGQAATNQTASLTAQGGDATASGIMGRTNALTGAIGQGISMYNADQNRQTENSLMNRYLTARGY